MNSLTRMEPSKYQLIAAASSFLAGKWAAYWDQTVAPSPKALLLQAALRSVYSDA